MQLKKNCKIFLDITCHITASIATLSISWTQILMFLPQVFAFRLKVAFQSNDGYAKKQESRVVVAKLKILSLKIAVWHHSRRLVKLNTYPCDRTFNPPLTTIKDSYILVLAAMTEIYTKLQRNDTCCIPDRNVCGPDRD